MEMLYRLSYVGFDDRDVQVGSTARMKRSVGSTAPDRDDVAQRPGVERRTPPRRLSLRESRREFVRVRESKCNGHRSQREIKKIFPMARKPDSRPPECPRNPGPTSWMTRAGGRIWSGKRDSNPRPSAWKADALAAELFPLKSLQRNKMVVGEGFEPSKASPTDLQSVPFDRSGTPPTPRRLGRAADTEIQAGEGTRTPNHLITNEMLYQLSYASRARATSPRRPTT